LQRGNIDIIKLATNGEFCPPFITICKKMN